MKPRWVVVVTGQTRTLNIQGRQPDEVINRSRTPRTAVENPEVRWGNPSEAWGLLGQQHDCEDDAPEDRATRTAAMIIHLAGGFSFPLIRPPRSQALDEGVSFWPLST